MSQRRVEWPTVAVAVVLYSLWFGVVFGHRFIPAWVSILAVGWTSTWFGSLQHEVLHRHPTSSERVNRLLVALPVSLWIPYERYRDSHLEHHASDLTVPSADPETFYIPPDRWARLGALGRAVHWANRTFLGRMLLGSVIRIVGYLWHEARAFPADRALRRCLAVHGLGVVAVVGLVEMAGMPWWEYLSGSIYLGTMLMLVRSFVEHRAVNADHQPLPVEQRTAVVRSRGPMALLFLNNNLHHTHHVSPGTPWYELPRLHRAMGSDAAAAAGAGWYRSFGQVAWRFLLRPFCQPVHPSSTVAAAGGQGR